MTSTAAVELVAACGFETLAPGVGEHSFTRALIDELRFDAFVRPFTVAELYQKILARLKYWSPKYSIYGDSSERRITLIHIQLSASESRRSIKLEPFKAQEAEIYSHPNTLTKELNSKSPSGASLVEKDCDIAMSELLPFSVPKFKSHQVLISIALEDSQLDVEAWKKWIFRLPSKVKHGRFEGVYESDSALLLLSLPAAIWTFLPNNPAFSFIGFVRYRNWLETYPIHSEEQNSFQENKETGNTLPLLTSAFGKPENLDSPSNHLLNSTRTIPMAGKISSGFPTEISVRSKLLGEKKFVDKVTSSLDGQSSNQSEHTKQQQDSQWLTFYKKNLPHDIYLFSGTPETSTKEQIERHESIGSRGYSEIAVKEKISEINLRPDDLHDAILDGNESKVLNLINSHVNINAQIENPIEHRFVKHFKGATALHIAARHGHAKIIKLLLERGADPCLKDSKGHTALGFSARHGYEVSMMLLLDKCTDVNKYNVGDSLLHSAAMTCGEMGVKLLLEE